MMRRCLAATAVVVFAWSAASPGEAPVQLGEPTELLKLPKDQVPPITFARPIVRVSPDAKQLLYIRMYGGGKAKLHLRTVGDPRSDGPVVWDEPIPTLYCRMSFAGYAWRADGQRVLFCQEPAKGEDGYEAGVYGRRMRPWHMCYDLPNPQFTSCRHMRLDGATGCTSLSYSPDGGKLWTAFSDPKGFKVCGITGPKAGGRPTYQVLYRRTGAAIYHLVPSPDGKYLAWVETYPRKSGSPRRGPDLVVFDVAKRRARLRLALSPDIPGWLDAQPPVWMPDSRTVCYGDVTRVQGIWRREAGTVKIGREDPKPLVRDALAVGAVAEGVVLNRGPACIPMRQGLSSEAPVGSGADLPRSNDVVFCDPASKGTFVTLVPNASAQHVSGRHVVYAQVSGGDVLVLRAEIKRPKAKPVP